MSHSVVNGIDLKFGNNLRHRYRFKRWGQLTYIIGARCSDGLVMIADRRMWMETEYGQGNKIFKPIETVVIGCSGFKGIIDNLKEETKTRLKQTQTTLEKIRTIENIVKELNERYSSRLAEKLELIECIVAIKEQQTTRLFKVYGVGYSEEVDENSYTVTGSGEPYGAIFLKQLHPKGLIVLKQWNQQPDMNHIIPLLAYVMKMVQNLQVNITVGDGYNVWFIPKDKDLYEATKEQERDIETESNRIMRNTDLGQYNEDFYRKKADEFKPEHKPH